MMVVAAAPGDAIALCDFVSVLAPGGWALMASGIISAACAVDGVPLCLKAAAGRTFERVLPKRKQSEPFGAEN